MEIWLNHIFQAVAQPHSVLPAPNILAQFFVHNIFKSIPELNLQTSLCSGIINGGNWTSTIWIYLVGWFSHSNLNFLGDVWENQRVNPMNHISFNLRPDPIIHENPYKLPGNHYKIPENHPKIPWHHYKIPWKAEETPRVSLAIPGHPGRPSHPGHPTAEKPGRRMCCVATRRARRWAFWWRGWGEGFSLVQWFPGHFGAILRGHFGGNPKMGVVFWSRPHCDRSLES